MVRHSRRLRQRQRQVIDQYDMGFPVETISQRTRYRKSKVMRILRAAGRLGGSDLDTTDEVVETGYDEDRSDVGDDGVVEEVVARGDLRLGKPYERRKEVHYE